MTRENAAQTTATVLLGGLTFALWGIRAGLHVKQWIGYRLDDRLR